MVIIMVLMMVKMMVIMMVIMKVNNGYNIPIIIVTFLVNYKSLRTGKARCSMRNSTINTWPFSIAMLNYQRVVNQWPFQEPKL